MIKFIDGSKMLFGTGLAWSVAGEKGSHQEVREYSPENREERQQILIAY